MQVCLNKDAKLFLNTILNLVYIILWFFNISFISIRDINCWLYRQTFPANLCYETAIWGGERRKNVDRVRTSRYETGRLISVILSVYPWTPPVFLLPFHPTARFYIVFLSVSRLFSARLSPSYFNPSILLRLSSPLGISHSPSAPESCLQIRATGFPTFLAHPKDEHPPTLGHIHPSPKLPRRLSVLFFYACLFRRQRSPR